MAVFTNLKKQVSKYVWITPFSEVEEFPTYVNEGGQKVPLSDEWREVKFKVLYPNLKALNQLTTRSVRLHVVRGTSTPQKEFDPERLAEFIAGTVIKDWENVTDDEGGSVDYDKEFMKDQFMASQFLLNEFVTYYQRVGEDMATVRERSGEDFL